MTPMQPPPAAEAAGQPVNIHALVAPYAPKPALAVVPTDRGNRATQSGTSPPLKVQLFASLKGDTAGHVEELAWPALVGQLMTREYPAKDACPMFAAGLFPAGPIKGQTPVEFHVVVGEHDTGTVSIEKARRRLTAAGVQTLLYTSASHTDEQPRWRVVAPLSAAVEPGQYMTLLERLNGALGGCLAPESTEPGRRWFYGRVRGAPFEAVKVDGAPLDRADGIEPLPVPGRKRGEPARYVVPGEVAARAPEEQARITEKASKLLRIAFEGGALDGRSDWQTAASAYKYETAGEGEELFVELSSNWPGSDKTPAELADYAARTWETSGNKEGGQLVRMGTLVELAQRGNPDAVAEILADENRVTADDFDRPALERISGLACCYSPAELAQEIATLPEHLRTRAVGLTGPYAAETASELDRIQRDAAAAQPAAPRFQITNIGEFAKGGSVEWLVKGLLPRHGLGFVYGPPGSGKTFWTLDVAFAIARGLSDWRGRRVKQAGVVYVAGEGAMGVRQRAAAYLRQHGIEGAPIGVIDDVPNLFTGATDHLLVAERVNQMGNVGLIILDTLSATTAGANENAGEDMGRVIERAKALGNLTGAMVLLVHHSGKSIGAGLRGWSGLLGAADVVVEFAHDDDTGARQASVEKLKDGEGGAVYPFRLVPVQLGVDADGDLVSSCVVEQSDAPVAKKGRKVESGDGPRSSAFVPQPSGAAQIEIHEIVCALGGKDGANVPVRQVLQQLKERKENTETRFRSDNAMRTLTQMVDRGVLVRCPGLVDAVKLPAPPGIAVEGNPFEWRPGVPHNSSTFLNEEI